MAQQVAAPNERQQYQFEIRAPEHAAHRCSLSLGVRAMPNILEVARQVRRLSLSGGHVGGVSLRLRATGPRATPFFHCLLTVCALATCGYVGCAQEESGISPWPAIPDYVTTNELPFLLQQQNLTSIRYQQVYNAVPIFTNITPQVIYVSDLVFYISYTCQGASGWTMTNLQVNLSTTSRSAGTLSAVFSENVGADETTVLGPTNYTIPYTPNGERFDLFLDKPFIYIPARGNLLLDIRISGAGPFDHYLPSMEAYSPPNGASNGGSSRAWAADVRSTTATLVDNNSLSTAIAMFPIPSLTVQYYPYSAMYQATNLILLTWPPQPSIFKLQQAFTFGSHVVWRDATNEIFAGNLYGNFAKIIAPAAGPMGFFRLVWSNGYAASVVSSVSRSIKIK